ncbi:MAG: hypothetical protein KAX64_03965 [Chromatiaceae bacterium]|nr:hypothetical protein [Chromatiaceae bacterium]MBP8282642.1 hypothetical protein [Chromatiaceae bacterium]
MVAALAAALLLTACAVGNKYDYRMPTMAIPVQGAGEVGLVVADERPYVLSGNKPPDFVGLQRGGFGNPFDVTTQSGAAMAQDMAATLKDALAAKGYRVTLIEGDAKDSAALGRKAGERGLRRVIVLHIKEWKTDTMVNTKLLFDLQLIIVDQAGKVVAKNAINGTSTIGGGMPGSIAASARQSFESKIGQLFYPPEIREALDGGASRR